MNFDLSIILENVRELVRAFLGQIPNIILGIIVIAIFIFIARRMSSIVERFLSNLSDEAQIAVSRILQWVVILLGIFIALTLIFPSVAIADLLALLGVGGVAIGFAFRDILQNFFAGLIILLTEPFEIGDQIVVGDYEGTVIKIKTRGSYIRTYDGRIVIIPNAELFTDSVVVNTANEKRRSEYDIGIGYGDDIDRAKELILEALGEISEVEKEPAPEALVVDLAGSSINIRARWWTEPERATVIHTHSKVLTAVAQKLSSNGVDMPFPTQVVLFHDQTEETDGDRKRQREGWPVPANGEAPQPQRIVDAINNSQNGNDQNKNNQKSSSQNGQS